MAGNAPDGKIFKPLAKQTIERARAGGKYPRVRWWGEMVNVLYVNGNPSGSNRLEQFFDEVAHEERIAIFCSFLMDKFNPEHLRRGLRPRLRHAQPRDPLRRLRAPPGRGEPGRSRK